jgi:hypothetical protein
MKTVESSVLLPDPMCWLPDSDHKVFIGFKWQSLERQDDGGGANSNPLVSNPINNVGESKWPRIRLALHVFVLLKLKAKAVRV